MVTLSNLGSGQTDETTVTVANSATGGDAWGSVAIGTAATMVFDDVGGTTWYRFSTGATSSTSIASWQSAQLSPTSTRSFGRVYFRIPTGNIGLQTYYMVRLRSGATQIARISLSTGSKVQFRNSPNTALFQTAAVLSEETNYRVEWDIASGATADGVVKLFVGESTTPLETMTATGANFGSGNIDEVSFGPASAAANLPAFWLRGFNANDVALPGPLVAEVPASATDTAGLVDSVSTAFTFGRTVVDAAAGDDSIVTALPGVRTASDAAAIVDTATAELSTGSAIAVDSAPIADSASFTLGGGRVVVDAFGLIDVVDAVLGRGPVSPPGSSPQHAVLTPNVVKVFTFNRDWSEIEVAIIDNPAVVWVRPDGEVPVAMEAGCEVLPAALSFSTMRPRTLGNTVIKVLSQGSPTISVRGVGK